MANPLEVRQFEIAQVPISVSGLDEAVARLINATKGIGEAGHFHFICASSVFYAEQDQRLQAVYKEASANYADGKSIVLGGKLLGNKRIEQVRGPSFFLEGLNKGRQHGLRHFFVGATEESLQRLNSRLRETYSGLEIVGHFAPPFREMTELEIHDLARTVKTSNSNVVWLGISTPRQDLLAHSLSQHLNIPVVAVGAAFDFASGAQKEAPKWVQMFYCEWLYRLLMNPKRLWRRYLIGNIVFIRALLREIF